MRNPRTDYPNKILNPFSNQARCIVAISAFVLI